MTRRKGRHEGHRPSGGTGARAAMAAAIVLAVGTMVAMVLLWPDGSRHVDTSALGPSREVYPGRVESAADIPCAGAEAGSPGCRRVSFLLLEGPDADTTVELELFADSPRVTELDAGDEVLMGYQPEAPEGARYAFLDPDRRTMLVFLLGLFAAAVILLGGIRGAAALAGLAATVGVLMVFVSRRSSTAAIRSRSRWWARPRSRSWRSTCRTGSRRGPRSRSSGPWAVSRARRCWR